MNFWIGALIEFIKMVLLIGIGYFLGRYMCENEKKE